MCKLSEGYVCKAKAEEDKRNSYVSGVISVLMILGLLHYWGVWALT
jgi:hypothetical protein